MTRFRLTSLMILVAAIAAVLGAMRVGSEWVFQVAFLLLILALLTGLLGAIVSRGDAAWVGFAVFLWGYSALLWYLAISSEEDLLLPNVGIALIADSIHPTNAPAPSPPRLPAAFLDKLASRERIIYSPDLSQNGDLYSSFIDSSSEKFDTSMLSPSERATLEAYGRSVKDHRARHLAANEKSNNAQVIGMIGTAIIAGLFGSMLGPFLSRRFAPRPTPAQSPASAPRSAGFNRDHVPSPSPGTP